MQKILVTGAAGFIGHHLVSKLIGEGHLVWGIDNINDYYDVNLKYARLAENGIIKEVIDWQKPVRSVKFDNYQFIRMDLNDNAELMSLCETNQFNTIINLAAQAGVRYSIVNPYAYIQSNVSGFLNVLEACRNFGVQHLIYASSSSVYGLNTAQPFSASHAVNHPVSLYAATKKANELMAHSYSHLYKIPTTGLRFFTVYGPWGRPDMAYFSFADDIVNNKTIKVFNHGNMKRDFTYIDDVISGIVNLIDHKAMPDPDWKNETPDPSSSSAPYHVYNIGNNAPVELMTFINNLEKALERKANIEFMDMQPGDVLSTWADVDDLMNAVGYTPHTKLDEGILRFIEWYKEHYQIGVDTANN
ncbi:NAD-dependent epimerase [Mucilaginibacter sp. CAU 1740]|uniref:NAD-dependent epimerase n=1 Tax=Mucilaginibacter sp. CAU 1740 TaxID=3140365 RepID=UPI00325B016A